ncbi:acetamidase/formamidase family protein [Gemmatimonas sp.]|uniref:acetamidase/formamidase family protein n=1 Tax=Gemmatimonas sp. TaxID=1962908 RepID=UPI0035639A49
MAVVTLDADTDLPLGDAPTTGHNRWHWDIEPVVRCASGDVLVVATRDALDGQLGRSSSSDDILSIDTGRIHPLVGPIWIEGAQPGDLLEIEVIEVIAPDYGFTSQRPGLGLLDGELDEPFLVHWDLADGWARSAQLQGVRIAGDPFLGIMGVAPSESMITEVLLQEADAAHSPTEPRSAIPSTARVCSEGLRTGPPRRHGGNIDLKQLGAGARAYLPVLEPGALLSLGDAHFAQGDGEVCGTAIEMRSVARLRVRLHSSAADPVATLPFFEHTPRPVVMPSAVLTTLGYPPSDDPDRLRGAAASAVRQLSLRIVEAYGYSFPAAYALCSVAADLRVPQVVNEPNISVTASIALDVFDDGGERMRLRGSTP